ncbi:MAG: hypothetical protein JO372_21550 [Solirubrobacterales bacterium]|nr:hypothetical protein [Solirubrobacterales bacterium]
MSTAWISTRRGIAVVAIPATCAALAIGSLASFSDAKTAAAGDGTMTTRALALHDGMRALWEAHGTWTERAIVDFVGDLPDTKLVIARLLQNQVDIGNAVKPYYGNDAGSKLTELLKAHINAAVGLLEAAKSGDSATTAKAKAAFYANGNQVARFLHAANPRQWSLNAMKTMMRIHLDQVVALAVDQLKGQYADAIHLYNVYIGHILDMADMLSTGIIKQFPARFS